ncbi:MAG: sulfatase/phosphatase domain-containing protein, partial [Candidatus Hodarchaeota archaeon]
SVSNSLVSTIDLPKTILSILGVKEKHHPEAFQGYDIIPVLKDPSKKIRERILIEHDEEIAKDKIMRLRTLITEKYRLTIYDGFDNLGDLFDLQSDPSELNNLWNSHRELRGKITEELLREIISLQPRIPKRNAYN